MSRLRCRIMRKTHAARTISREDGLILIYYRLAHTKSKQTNERTFPTASPTKPFISICKLLRRFDPSSGDAGSAWATSGNTLWFSANASAEIILFLGRSILSGTVPGTIEFLLNRLITGPGFAKLKLKDPAVAVDELRSSGENELISSTRRFLGLGRCC